LAYQTQSEPALVSQKMKQQKIQFLEWREDLVQQVGTDDALKLVFSMFDKDKNGLIDRNELSDGFKALGLQCTKQQISQLIEEINGVNSKIDFITCDQFAQAIAHWSANYEQTAENRGIDNISNDDADNDKFTSLQSNSDVDSDNNNSLKTTSNVNDNMANKNDNIANKNDIEKNDTISEEHIKKNTSFNELVQKKNQIENFLAKYGRR